jgi:hypothetical protein
MYIALDSSEMKEIIGGSFGVSQDPVIIQEALEFAISVCAMGFLFGLDIYHSK